MEEYIKVSKELYNTLISDLEEEKERSEELVINCIKKQDYIDILSGKLESARKVNLELREGIAKFKKINDKINKYNNDIKQSNCYIDQINEKEKIISLQKEAKERLKTEIFYLKSAYKDLKAERDYFDVEKIINKLSARGYLIHKLE